MSIELEGAVNRLTAAVLAAATTYEYRTEGTGSLVEARDNVEDRYESHLSSLLE